MSPTLRLPAVAGSFYPADPEVLSATVDRLLAEVPDTTDDRRPIALVAPHAGYVYSGPVAATAYARLRPWRDAIGRVVIVGPAHRVPVRGLALSSVDAFATPLGPVAVDHAGCEALLGRPGTAIHDDAHAPEHSIEVQLPFLQRVLGDDWSLVPVVAGFASAAIVADALAEVWAAPGTLVVISTDLSHYHDQETAVRLDRATAATIVAAAWERLDGARACGAVALSGALDLVRRRHERIELLHLATSADTIGPPDRVVGYGSFVVR